MSKYNQKLPKWSLIRINAPPNRDYEKGDEDNYVPFEFVNIDGEFSYEQLRPLLSHYDKDKPTEIGIGRSSYSLWCSNGKRRKIEIYYDDEGLCKLIPVNHTANAMIDCGRFTSKKFDYVDGKSYNQKMKDEWGSPRFVGDVICKIRTGTPIPDCSIFGENPVSWIFHHKKPNSRMIAKHGSHKKAIEICDSLIHHPFPSGLISINSERERKVGDYMLGNADFCFGQWWCAEILATHKFLLPKLMKEIKEADIIDIPELYENENYRIVLGESKVVAILPETIMSIVIEMKTKFGEILDIKDA